MIYCNNFQISIKKSNFSPRLFKTFTLEKRLTYMKSSNKNNINVKFNNNHIQKLVLLIENNND